MTATCTWRAGIFSRRITAPATPAQPEAGGPEAWAPDARGPRAHALLGVGLWRIAVIVVLLSLLAGHHAPPPPPPVQMAVSAADSTCHIAPHPAVPITIGAHSLLIPVSVNGTTVPMILDTGADATMFSEQAAARLGILNEGRRHAWINGFGGRSSQGLGRLRALALGGLALHRHDGDVIDTVLVGTIHIPDVASGTAAGVLGLDYLDGYDLDIDLADHRFGLVDVSGCAQVAPWPAESIPATVSRRHGLMFAVAVNHAHLTAMLDTGSEKTVTLASGSARSHLRTDCTNVDIVGFGPARSSGCWQTVRLDIGRQSMANARIVATSVQVLHGLDMALGLDWLAHRHVWASPATGRLLVARATDE